MNKQIKNISKNHLSNFSKFFLSKEIFKHYYFFLKLKNQWDNYLFIYKSNKKNFQKLSSEFLGEKFFSLLPIGFQREDFKWSRKEKIYKINYLILAKLVNFIGTTQILQNKIRKCLKIYIKHFDLTQIFQLKLIPFAVCNKKNVFFYWISFLLIEQIGSFIKTYNSFICKSNFILFQNKLEIFNQGNFLLLKCSDFFTLKWYQNKIHFWCYQVLIKSTEILNSKIDKNLSLFSQINTIFYLKKKNIIFSQAKTKNFHKQIVIKTGCVSNRVGNNFCNLQPIYHTKFIEKNLFHLFLGKLFSRWEASCQFSKQKYLNLIKKNLQKNKITNQIQLIQKLNNIIKNWDPFIINTLTKKKFYKLNLLIYQLLWHWGFVRHKKQKARWLKNRYWHQYQKDPEKENKNLLFSVL